MWIILFDFPVSVILSQSIINILSSKINGIDYIPAISDTFSNYNTVTLIGMILTLLLQIVVIVVLYRNYVDSVDAARNQNELTSHQNSVMEASLKSTERTAQSSILIGIIMEYYNPLTQQGRDILLTAYEKNEKPKIRKGTKKWDGIIKAVNIFEMIGTLTRNQEVQLGIVSGMMNRDVVNTWLGLLVYEPEEISLIDELRGDRGKYYLANFEWLYEQLKPLSMRVVDAL